jgi:hypothetical protein
MKFQIFKKIINDNSDKYNQGFVALFTVLIASIVLAMALGIADISLKQIVLSGSASDASKSFYAADSGIECALYNDLRAVPSPFGQLGLGGSISCAEGSSELNPPGAIPNPPGVTDFYIDFTGVSGDSCAYVVVDKTDLSGLTNVTSRGTNVACGVVSSRKVERAIQITY